MIALTPRSTNTKNPNTTRTTKGGHADSFMTGPSEAPGSSAPASEGVSPISPAPRQAGQRQGRESPADVRLDGDQMTADPEDGDAGASSRPYMSPSWRFTELSAQAW
jgi:hypothetical protein